MKIITTKVFTYDELSDAAKQKACEWFSDGYPEDEWWDATYEDARIIGLKITGFGLDGARHATGEFIDGAFNCANAIIANHGSICETYKTAESFLKEWGELPDTDSEDSRADDGDALEGDFLKSLLEDYSMLLQKECDYLQSREHIEDMIRINEYTFTDTGKRFG